MKKYAFHLVIIVGIMVIFLSCEKDQPDPLTPYEQYQIDSVIIADYITNNDLDAFEVDYNSTATGIYCAITENGTVETNRHPDITTTVTVRYKGYFTNGDVFDEVWGNDSIEFSLSQAIWGWKVGFTALTKGDKATLLIPSYRGYGSTGSGSIPANTVLLFDVELIDF